MEPRTCVAQLEGGRRCARKVRVGETLCRAHGGKPLPVSQGSAKAVELPDGLEPRVSPKQLARALGIGTVTLWRMRRRGEIPQPDRITPGRSSWPLSTAQRVIAERQAGGERQ